MLWNMGSIALYHVGSPQTGDGTRVSCIGRPILIHWASREAPRLNSHCTFCLVSDPISLLQAVSLQWGKCWSRWLNSGSGPLMGSDICFSPSNYQFLPLHPFWFICEETQSPDWSLWKGDRWPLSQPPALSLPPVGTLWTCLRWATSCPVWVLLHVDWACGA